MDTPPLPQTSPQGGPNPNTNPGGFGVSVMDLPNMPALIGQAQATTPDAQRAQLMQVAQQRQAAALAPSPAVPTAVGNLPAFGAPAPAPAPDPNHSPLYNSVAQGVYDATNMQSRPYTTMVAHLQPGVGDTIKHYLWDAQGSPEAQAYNQNAALSNFYTQPDAKAYLSQHPDLATAADANPVRFATALGPVLEAHQKELAGQATPGSIPVTTPDGHVSLPVNNMEKHAALKSALGTSDQATAILMHPEKYDSATWAKAAQAHGITNNQLNMMWGMQHYLPPQQQALSGAVGLGLQDYQRSGTDAARQRLEAQLRLIGAGQINPQDYNAAN